MKTILYNMHMLINKINTELKIISWVALGELKFRKTKFNGQTLWPAFSHICERKKSRETRHSQDKGHD